MEQFVKIAFATDFSDGAQLAFEQALVMARNRSSELFLVHVLPPLTQPISFLNELAMSNIPSQVKEDVKSSAMKKLEDIYIKKCDGIHKVEKVLLEGDPAKALAEFAASNDIDLLVVGSTGLSGLAKAMFGSVAAKVVQKVPCSVMVVRRKKNA